jgi:N-acetylmuramoyl-L-alanine amidase
MRPISEIIVHCAATRPEWMAGATLAEQVEEIRRWHVQGNGWSDIGYHRVIGRDGTVASGRPMDKTGAHTLGHNTGTIGVCLIGGHGANANDAPDQHFTSAQMAALVREIKDLKRRFGPLKVSGHNQYANKGCPGFYVPKWLAGVQFAPTKVDPPVPWFARLIARLFGLKMRFDP